MINTLERLNNLGEKYLKGVWSLRPLQVEECNSISTMTITPSDTEAFNLSKPAVNALKSIKNHRVGIVNNNGLKHKAMIRYILPFQLAEKLSNNDFLFTMMMYLNASSTYFYDVFNNTEKYELTFEQPNPWYFKYADDSAGYEFRISLIEKMENKQ